MCTAPQASDRWRFWIDQGGTFTDVIGLAPDGTRHVEKLLSDAPDLYAHAPLEGIRRLLGVEAGAPLPEGRVAEVRMGTTKATNALLERKGERMALLVTEGLEDVLEIGTQDRPEIFALRIEKPETLPERVVGVRERLAADGSVVRPLDHAQVERALAELREEGFDSLAVCLLHAYLEPAHERIVGERARAAGFAQVSLSHQVACEIKVVGRGDTTCVDAYLTPVLRRYLERLAEGLPRDARLFMMQSNGGLADLPRFSGKNAVLSGPAGGVVACARLAEDAGLERVIGFDMGGTSTDVCRYAGRFERTFETRVAGVRLKAPMLDIVTVAAGGGSTLRYETGRFLVGPESAGADPGPACYGRGGPLAVTDANLVLGRLQPGHFPRCFGPGGDAPLDPAPAREALQEIVRRVRETEGREMSVEEVALGFVRVANESMARPIREISVEKGHDLRDHALLAFGGAAAQHACALARSLGMARVLLHPLGGVLSAYGIGLADVVHEDVRAVLRTLDGACLEELSGPAAALEREARAALRDQGVPPERVQVAFEVELRYRGVDQSLDLPLDLDGPLEELVERFEAAHRRLYGFVQEGVPLELLNLRVRAAGGSSPPPEPEAPAEPRMLAPSDAVERVPVVFPDGGGAATRETPVFLRRDLSPGARVEGPALLIEDVSTVVVDPGWSATCTAAGHLLLEDEGGSGRTRHSTARDPVTLELMNNLFMSCAEQMGRTLERVSHSTNIKERLDFSCALFDRRGELIANAPHIPVHLGAMGATVRAVLEEVGGTMAPGDVFVSNDPFHGGSHLPDVTVVTPIFSERGELRFVVANRGHHADIGGISPGSMPPFSRSIDEEGIRFHGFPLIREGRFREEEVLEHLRAGPYPARNLEERLSDLRAQVAANQCGVRLLAELEERLGFEVLDAYMGHMCDNGEEAVRELLASLPDGSHGFEDFLDEGARVALTVTITGDTARFDFTGTDDALPGNLNAPRAVVRAAVLYALRCMTRRSLPLNSGCLRPVELVVRPGSLLDPRPPAAVVGGNVETSQRVVDVIFGALGKLAAAQGTMNNLTFGTDAFGYYETLCGGAGAGLGFDGASAVHTHMTNTRITDPEVLERRYPVRVRRFGVRRGSGGAGPYRGGDGVVRELEFLAPVRASILSERRAVSPFGLRGADPGARGRNAVRRGAQVQELPARARVGLDAGDVLRVETPGGGGYEPSAAEWAAMAPEELRRLCAAGRFDRPTTGVCAGHVQANLIVLPAAQGDAFEEFCRENPRPCPLLERLPAGTTRSRALAPGADLRVALPRYLLHGEVPGRGPAGGHPAEALDLDALPPDEELALFLLGCSFGFEGALMDAGLPPRQIEEGCNVPMYRTTRPLVTAGPFGGELVVSMRPYLPEQVDAVTAVTAGFPRAHGAPVHVGDPGALGIDDLSRPDFGDAVSLREGEVPVFWACGVTSQEACRAARAAGHLPWFASHAPGHMLVADLRDQDLREGPA